MNTSPRRPSPLQRSILVVLAALDVQHPGTPVPTRLIERLLADTGQAVYGPNLRGSCRRLEAAGLLRTLRAQNLQLEVELTDAGREMAMAMLVKERHAETERQRCREVRILPVREQNGEPEDRKLNIDGRIYTACRGTFVIRLNGTTCLQLWSCARHHERLEGDALQVAGWYQDCHSAGLPVQVQINESE